MQIKKKEEKKKEITQWFLAQGKDNKMHTKESNLNNPFTKIKEIPLLT